MDWPFPAYKGTEPYVFISYSHRDSPEVYVKMSWMNESGFNVWYDEGIEAGIQWTDALADSIENAALFVYFVTPRSAASENCRDEVSFAIEHGIDVIPIYLEETKLRGGLSLTLSTRQTVHKFQLSEGEYQKNPNRDWHPIWK